MKKKRNYILDTLRIVSWILAVILVYFVFTDSNPTQFTLEGIGVVLALLYAYQKIHAKMLVVIYSAILALIYAFVNVSGSDLIAWVVIGLCAFYWDRK